MTTAKSTQDGLSYPPRLLSIADAARYVGFGTTKFRELVTEKTMPEPIDVDGSQRWDRLDLDAACEDLKERRRDPLVLARERIHAKLKAQGV